jgi:hypothetical protein
MGQNAKHDEITLVSHLLIVANIVKPVSVWQEVLCTSAVAKFKHHISCTKCMDYFFAISALYFPTDRCLNRHILRKVWLPYYLMLVMCSLESVVHFLHCLVMRAHTSVLKSTVLTLPNHLPSVHCCAYHTVWKTYIRELTALKNE